MREKSQKKSFSIIGAGRVGTALGLGLKRAGYRLLDVMDRSSGRAADAVALIGQGRPLTGRISAEGSGDFTILSVPDREIAPLVKWLFESEMTWEGNIVFHCSGSLTASILSPLSQKGASTGSLHPIQTFSRPELAADRLEETWYGIEGSDRFKKLARRLVHDLGGTVLDVPGDRKVLYHAAAVMASNLFVALVHQAAEVLSEVGIEQEKAVKALLPLIEGTVAGIVSHGTIEALTGPIERGDYETVRTHLDLLERLDPKKSALYRLLSFLTLPLASGRNSPEHQKILGLLKESEKRE